MSGWRNARTSTVSSRIEIPQLPVSHSKPSRTLQDDREVLRPREPRRVVDEPVEARLLVLGVVVQERRPARPGEDEVLLRDPRVADGVHRDGELGEEPD